MYRSFYSLLIISIITIPAYSQNVGIGNSNPSNKLEVTGNFLVTQPTYASATAPAVSQTINMINGTETYFAETDSVGHLYDPSGPGNNYIPNLSATTEIDYLLNQVGIEITIDDIDLGSGDSLIIYPYLNADPPRLIALGDGYNSPAKFIINDNDIFIVFKSNSDAGIGRGFSLSFRRLFKTDQPDVKNYAGNTLYFNSAKGALRTGTNILDTVGINSTGLGNGSIASGSSSAAIGYATKATGIGGMALGYQATASGFSSISLGYLTEATGPYCISIGTQGKATGNGSTVFGLNCISSGLRTTAMGFNTTASGDNATAIGNNTMATGINAIAIGTNTTASTANATSLGTNTIANGAFSTAMGNFVSTSGYDGAFALGDHSTTTVMQSFVANGFRSRFAGGYRLLTNSAASLGVVLVPDASSWSAISDARLKENFLPINGENILNKIAAMPLTTWNYKTQNNKTSRHYGPMAQDFFAAFGKDNLGIIGCDTLINQQDFLGVNLIAIQALEKRTTQLQDKLNTTNELLETYQQKIILLEEENKKILLLLNNKK